MLAPRAIHLGASLLGATLLSLACSVKPTYVDNSGGAASGGGAPTTDDAGVDNRPPCTTASDCPGTDTECFQRACVSSKCSPELTPRGTVLLAQLIGDCRASVCDGFGHELLQLNGLDAPVDTTKGDCKSPRCAIDGSVTEQIDDRDVDDGDPCTQDSCNNGQATHMPLAEKSHCGDCLRCELGKCVTCGAACMPGGMCPTM